MRPFSSKHKHWYLRDDPQHYHQPHDEPEMPDKNLPKTIISDIPNILADKVIKVPYEVNIHRLSDFFMVDSLALLHRLKNVSNEIY